MIEWIEQKSINTVHKETTYIFPIATLKLLLLQSHEHFFLYCLFMAEGEVFFFPKAYPQLW